jgi:peroxiredoxin Q/BCP
MVMLNIGEKAPDFTLNDSQGNAVAIGELLKDGPVLLYFYPMDFTPTCTKQACMVRDVFSELKDAGVQVIGINTSGKAMHGKFSKTFKLPFTLLSDPGRKVAKQYDASAMFGLMTERISYFIDRAGKIADREKANFSVKPHKRLIERVLERVKSPHAGA